ncbi:MAG: S9 family peptidase, partial [Bryobacteraceae bacterium]
MKTRFSVVVILAVVASLTAQNVTQPAGSQKRFISEKDLFTFVWIADPQLSPDGTRVLFTRVIVDDKRTGYETSIWIADSSGKRAPIRMTNGRHDARPRWSPDGTHIVLVRGGEKDEAGKPKPSQLAMLSLAGGEASTITDLPKGASGPVWSPDGTRIAFESSTTGEDLQKAERKNSAKPGDSQAESPHESDVHVITRAVYRSNDAGYLDPKRHVHIWLLEVPASSDQIPKPVQLTSGDFDEQEPVWSRDGSRIYFTARHVAEPYYELPSTDIYSVPAAGGNSEKLATTP